MASTEHTPETVVEFVRRALPAVNENLDWETLKARFDPDPVGNSLGMVLYKTDADGTDKVVESFGFRVVDGPTITLDQYDIEAAGNPSQVFGLGDVITYRETAINVLHPDRDLTPQKACYQRGEVDLNAANPIQKRRVWLVGSAILEMITHELDTLLSEAEMR